MKKWMTASLLGTIALMSLNSSAHAQGYTVTDLGILSGAYQCSPTAINNSGWVVGSSQQRNIPHYKGWLWTPTAPNAPTGSLRALEPLAGQTYSSTWDVNNSGQCVGQSYGVSEEATLWQAPNFTPVDINNLPRNPLDPSVANWVFKLPKTVSDPDAGSGAITLVGYGRLVTDDPSVNRVVAWSIASDGTIMSVEELSGGVGYPAPEVNNQSQIVAKVQTVTPTGNTYQACLWNFASSQIINLGALSGGTNSSGMGIDDFGDVVGDAETLDSTTNTIVRHGFLWTPGTANGTTGAIVGLGTLGGTRSAASGINHNVITNSDPIVGWAYTKRDSAEHACLWQKAGLTAGGTNTPVDLNTLRTAGATGLNLLEAYRVNNAGSIIGLTMSGSAQRSFLLTPR